MSYELIERVARALSCHLWATVAVGNNDDCDEFDAMPAYVKDIYRKAARAAIAAMPDAERMRKALLKIELLSTNHAGHFDQPGQQFNEYTRLGEIAREALGEQQP